MSCLDFIHYWKYDIKISNYWDLSTSLLISPSFALCILLTVIWYIYEIWSEVIQSCNMKNKDIYWRRYKIQETLYIGQWCLSPLQSRHLGTSHSSPNCHQLPHSILPNLTDGLKSLLFQRWFYFWEKPDIAGCQIWAVAGLSHLGDLMLCKKLHETWCVNRWVVMMKLPISSFP